MTPDSFRVLGLGATAFATALAALVALIGAANAPLQEAPSSGLPSDFWRLANESFSW